MISTEMLRGTEESPGEVSERMDHLEDVIVIWLDETINNDNAIWPKRQSRLQDCISFIRTFTDQNECMKYISTISDEHIFFIVSGSIGEIIVPELHDREQVREIYIFCCDLARHNQWSKSYPKIRGVFNDENPLMMCLEKNVKMYSNTLLPMNIAHPQERSLQDIDDEQVLFIWFHLIIEVLSRLPQSATAKQDMIDECCRHYSDNPTQLSAINDFKINYNNGNGAINWYTKNCFLHRLLNKAFRTENLDIIFNYHYFLSGLTKELTEKYLEQYGKEKGILTVYRGQRIHLNELERLKRSVGHLMSINTFFSASTTSAVAATFCGLSEDRNHGMESIIFQIEVDLSVQRRPFANISEYSQNKDENEILFAIGSVFRIESVELYLDNLWLCVLILTDEVKKEIDDLMAHFTKRIRLQPSILELGVLLSKIGDFERAKRFYLRLENELPKDHYDLGVLHNNLGEIYRQQGHLDTAMKYYVLAVDELVIAVDFLHPWFAIVHSNIAMVFDARHQLDEALVSYRCALSILEHFGDAYELELVSTIYNGMAAIHQRKGQFDQASEFYQKTLKIEMNILPSNHPSIATTLNNIGQLYFIMRNFSEAHEYLLRALPIFLSTLPNDHNQFAFLYTNLGAIYSMQNEISKALEYLLKAEEIIDRSPLTFDYDLRESVYRSLVDFSHKNKMIDLSIRMYRKLIDECQTQIPVDQYKIAYWTFNLANLLYNQRHHQIALEYQHQSLSIIEKLPRTEQNKDLYANIIDSFWRCKFSDIAIEHYKRLLQEETNEHSVFAGKINNNLGVIYDHLENDILALDHYKTALFSYEKYSNIYTKEIAIIYHNIAVIFNNLKDYDAARFHGNKSLNSLTELDYDIRARCYFQLGETYENCMDWTHAQQHFNEALELSMKANMSEHFVERCNRRLEKVVKNLEKSSSIVPAESEVDERGLSPFQRKILNLVLFLIKALNASRM